ncbi:MAG: ABC transporter ATP-binding protein [Oscillospiraceae bacterium]|nr:ABC transporter ATP-binding protein [Oscillospiraceae bacterium]MDD4414253.1 ABC transporter ATP-binding protein [Oscillospiraceae bacterium]
MKNIAVQKWLIKVAKKDGWIIILLSLISGIISLCTVWFALVSRNVIDIAIGDAEGVMWHESAKLIGLLVFQAVLNIIQSRLNTQVLGQMEIRINQSVFKRLFEKRWPEVNRYHSGDILNRMTSDVSVVVNTLVSLIPRWVSMITRLAACIIVLLLIDVTFTLILIAVGLSAFGFSRIYGKKMKKIHRECQETDGQTRSFIQECVENWMMIQSFGARELIVKRLKSLQNINFKKKVRRNNISNLARTAIYVLFSGSYYVAIAWGSWRLARGLITFGTLTAFLQIVNQIQLPFRNMSGFAPQYYNMLASAERLMEIELLEEETVPITKTQAAGLYESMKGITIDDLSFSYGDEPVFYHANFYINKGEFLAVAGHSGIGKSTLLKLLLGFFEPGEGSLSLETADRPVNVGAYTRTLFTYVPQGNMLLSGTVRQNIMFGNPDASEEQIMQAVQVAEISEFISELPDGIDTILGERGLGLSEGQVQRIAIARGVLSGAPIIMLDEATSALDETTEANVLKNLRELKGKTCICVSHRKAALAACDRAIEVVNGKIEIKKQ